MKAIPVRQITAQTTPGPDGRFSIRDIRQLLEDGRMVQELHKHDFYFLLALQKGSGLHEIDFTGYPVQDEVIFLLRPGQVHRLELDADCRGFLMVFDLSFYQPRHTLTERRWQKASARNYCSVSAERFNRLYTILTGIHLEFSNREEGYVEAIKASLDLFFIEYIRQSRHPQQPARAENTYTQERFEELLHLLDTHIRECKSVSDYAQLLHLSPYQLNAITKASVGKTVSDLINEQIILEAKRQLLATTSQVKEVADQLGYEDVSYFIRFFRKHTGESPEAFRRNYV